MWADYLEAKIPILTSATVSGAFTKGCESIQCTTALAMEVSEQYVTAQLGIVAARFEHKIDSVNKNIDWKWSLLDFCFRNIFNDTQRLTSIFKADIQMAIQSGLNEIEEQLFSLMGEFQQKLLDEASALDPTQLQMFTCGLHDHERGASVFCCCQARQQDEPGEDSFFRGGPTPLIHDALMKLPLHGELVYQKLLTKLEKAIEDHSSAIFQKIKQDVQAYNFSAAISTACNTGPSAAAGSATEVLKEEHPSGISFGMADRTLDSDSDIVSGIAIPSHTSANHETEDSDVMIVVTTPPPEHQALVEILVSQLAIDTKLVGTASQNVFKVTPTEQAEAVSTIQSMMDLEDQGKDPNTVTESVTPTCAPASTATAMSRDTLAMKLKLSAKELTCLQEMATNVRMEHLLQAAAQEGINMPALPSLPSLAFSSSCMVKCSFFDLFFQSFFLEGGSCVAGDMVYAAGGFGFFITDLNLVALLLTLSKPSCWV